MPRYVERALKEADILFVESLPGQVPAEEVRAFEFHMDERPSVRQMISEWDSARRDAFLEAFVEFPAYSSVQQAEELLEMRPWMASSYTSALMHTLAGLEPVWSASVEAWLLEYAEDHGLEIQALENPLRIWEAQDAMSQERPLLELEELVLTRPDRELVASGIQTIIGSSFEDWEKGQFTFDPYFFPRELGVPDDGWGFQDNEELGILMFEWREDIWIKTLDVLLTEDLQQKNAVDTLFVAVGLGHLHTEKEPFVEDLQQEGWVLMRQWP